MPDRKPKRTLIAGIALLIAAAVAWYLFQSAPDVSSRQPGFVYHSPPVKVEPTIKNPQKLPEHHTYFPAGLPHMELDSSEGYRGIPSQPRPGHRIPDPIFR